MEWLVSSDGASPFRAPTVPTHPQISIKGTHKPHLKRRYAHQIILSLYQQDKKLCKNQHNTNLSRKYGDDYVYVIYFGMVLLYGLMLDIKR